MRGTVWFAVIPPLLAACGICRAGEAQPHAAPLEIVRGKPFVMVTVNGKGPFRFLLDTGTGGAAMVTAELADQLQLPAAGETQLNDPSGQGGKMAPLVRIDSLRVAGVEFRDVSAVRHAIPGAEGQCLGMLGFPLFHNSVLTVDYVHARLLLGGEALVPDGERQVLSFRMQDGVPIVKLRIGRSSAEKRGAERWIEAQVDTGGGGLSLPEATAASLKFAEGPAVFGKAESLSTRFALKAGKLASDVHLGVYTLDRPWVEINPAFPLANLGGIPLQYFTLTFDQRDGLVRFDGPRRHIQLGETPTPGPQMNRPVQKPNLVPVG